MTSRESRYCGGAKERLSCSLLYCEACGAAEKDSVFPKENESSHARVLGRLSVNARVCCALGLVQYGIS